MNGGENKKFSPPFDIDFNTYEYKCNFVISNTL